MKIVGFGKENTKTILLLHGGGLSSPMNWAYIHYMVLN